MKKPLFSITLKDCVVQTFRSGGKGGQHQNKVESGVRITHTASGAVGECRETPSQSQNKLTAFRRMALSIRFKSWAQLKMREILTGESLEEKVDKMMEPTYIKVEGKDENGNWIEIN